MPDELTYTRRKRWLRALRQQKYRYEQVINTLLNYLMRVPDENIRLEHIASMLLQSTIIPVLQGPPPAPNAKAEELNTVKPKEWFHQLMDQWAAGEVLTPDAPNAPAIEIGRRFKQVLEEKIVILDKPKITAGCMYMVYKLGCDKRCTHLMYSPNREKAERYADKRNVQSRPCPKCGTVPSYYVDTLAPIPADIKVPFTRLPESYKLMNKSREKDDAD